MCAIVAQISPNFLLPGTAECGPGIPARPEDLKHAQNRKKRARSMRHSGYKIRGPHLLRPVFTAGVDILLIPREEVC